MPSTEIKEERSPDSVIMPSQSGSLKAEEDDGNVWNGPLTRNMIQNVSRYGTLRGPSQVVLNRSIRAAKKVLPKPPSPSPSPSSSESESSEDGEIVPDEEDTGSEDEPLVIHLDPSAIAFNICDDSDPNPANLPITWYGTLQLAAFKESINAAITLHHINGRLDESLIEQIFGPIGQSVSILSKYSLEDRTAETMSLINGFVQNASKCLFLILPTGNRPEAMQASSSNLKRMVDRLVRDKSIGSIIHAEANRQALVNFVAIDDHIQHLLDRTPFAAKLLEAIPSTIGKLVVILQYI